MTSYTGKHISQNVFKTIVEMAYEMERAQKKEDDKQGMFDALLRILPTIESRVNESKRLKAKPTNKHDCASDSFPYRSMTLRFHIYMEYTRTIPDDDQKICETGFATISLAKYYQTGNFYSEFPHSAITTSHRTRDEFTNQKKILSSREDMKIILNEWTTLFH